jgi:hypothetical protein
VLVVLTGVVLLAVLVLLVVVVDDSVVVGKVVVAWQGQSSTTGWFTATCRQTSASVADGGRLPFGAQMHSGEQARSPTATLRM